MIFGIGLGRTGTRSLTEALRLMGLNAVHWDNRKAHVLDRWYESDLMMPGQSRRLHRRPFRPLVALSGSSSSRQSLHSHDARQDGVARIGRAVDGASEAARRRRMV